MDECWHSWSTLDGVSAGAAFAMRIPHRYVTNTVRSKMDSGPGRPSSRSTHVANGEWQTHTSRIIFTTEMNHISQIVSLSDDPKMKSSSWTKP
jgi:hypothetical protein